MADTPQDTPQDTPHEHSEDTPQYSRLTRRALLEQGAALGAAIPLVGLAAGWTYGGRRLADNGITVTYMKSGTYDVAAQSILSAFQSKSGVKVNVLAFPFAVLEQKNQTDLVTQTGQYDVLSNSSWDIAFFNYLRPLDDYLKKDPSFAKDYVPGLFKDGPADFYQGKPVGVPYAMDAYGVFYRTDLFKKAGVTANWQTWPQLLATAKKLQNQLPAGVAPISFAFGAPEQVPAIFVGAYKGNYLNSTGKWEVERGPAVGALELTQEILKLGPKNALGLSIDEANAEFLQGKAAILIGWPSFVRAALNDPKQSKIGKNWALAYFPGPGFVWISNWNLSISKLSKNPDAAWEWIKAYVNPQNGKEWMVKYGIGSPFKSTYSDTALVKAHANDFPMQKRNLARSRPVPWTFQAFDTAYRVQGDMLTGKLSPNEVVDQWKKAWGKLPVPKALIDTAVAEGFAPKQ
jgi:ABC-type glycerol-3-phosphate transport system substrate-binding protein